MTYDDLDQRYQVDMDADPLDILAKAIHGDLFSAVERLGRDHEDVQSILTALKKFAEGFSVPFDKDLILDAVATLADPYKWDPENWNASSCW